MLKTTSSLPLFDVVVLKTRFVRGNIDTSFIPKFKRGIQKASEHPKKEQILTVQRSRHTGFALRERAFLEEKKRTFGERGARAHHVLRHVPHFIRVRVVMFPTWSSFVSRDDFDAHEVKRRRFFRLSFSQRFRLCSTKYSKEEIFPSREKTFWCARVCSCTQSDRDLLLLFVCALYTARSTKVVQVNKEHVRSCVGLLNGMIKIKGPKSRKNSLPYRRQKKRLGLHFLNIFSLISFCVLY